MLDGSWWDKSVIVSRGRLSEKKLEKDQDADMFFPDVGMQAKHSIDERQKCSSQHV